MPGTPHSFQLAGRSETAPYACSELPVVCSARDRRSVSDTPVRALCEAPVRPYPQRGTQDAER